MRALVPGALTTQRKTTAMTQTAIAAEVHQSLDRDTDFAAQVAFDDILADFGAQALDFGFGQITNLRGRGNACGFAELL